MNTKTRPACSIDGCDRPNLARGWCKAHYMRWKRHGDPLVQHNATPAPDKVCVVEGCERKHKAQGYCDGHYQRFRQTGEPGTAALQEKVARPDVCTFVGCRKKAVARELCGGHYKQQNDGRALSPLEVRGRRGDGYVTKEGYRIISINGTPILEHRHVMAQHLGRPLFSWETVDHLTGGHRGRSNNALSNLRLMVGKHPRGHEPENIVRYCRQMLGLYGDQGERTKYAEALAAMDLERPAAQGATV